MASCKINLIFQNTSIPNAPKSVELHFNAAGWILDTETLIQHNEKLRIEAEKNREHQESARQTAEAKREENTAEAIRNSEEATKKAEDEAARVRMLADNPPKIVEVEGAKYWAFWDEETGQYVVSENRADVGDAVLFSPQALTPQQQEQARKNIGVQTEYVFEDIDTNERSMYAYNGLIFYRNSNGKLSSFNEQTFETVSYDKITLASHSYQRNCNTSIKRFIVRDDKILAFTGVNSDRITLWNLSTQEKIYETTPLDANRVLWHSGFFLEIEGKVFLFAGGTGYDAVEIDFATGEVVKTISIFKDFSINNYYSYFSYENEDLSLFVVNNRMIKYDKSLDEFSILIDISSGTTENINVSKGHPTCIFKDPITDTNLLIFTTQGLCVNPLSDILIGKFDSTKNFVAPGGFNTGNLFASRPFAQFSENEFISRDIQIVIFNTHGYLHTYGLALNSDYNRLGYFTKGELGVVYNRGYHNGFNVDALPIYRRYGNDIH